MYDLNNAFAVRAILQKLRRCYVASHRPHPHTRG